MKKYEVIQEIFTEDNLYDAVETEYVSESDCLRDAIEDMLGGSGGVEAIELMNDCNYRIIAVNYGYDKLTGDWEKRILYFNTDVSIHSRKRIAKLLTKGLNQ